MKWWAIEHPTRGVLVEFDADGKPKFRWSIMRNEGWLFADRSAAETKLQKLPDDVRRKAYVIGPYKLPRR